MKHRLAKIKWSAALLGIACWLLLFFQVSFAIPVSLAVAILLARKSSVNHQKAACSSDLQAKPEQLPPSLHLIFDRKGFRISTTGNGAYHSAKNEEVADLFLRYGFQAADIQKVFFHLLGCLEAKMLQWQLILSDLPSGSDPIGALRANYKLSILPKLNTAGTIDCFDLHISYQEPKQTQEQASSVVDLKNYLHRDMIFALIRIPESVFRNFSDETIRLIQQAKTDIRKLAHMTTSELNAAADTMFRYVHTIKANARAFNFKEVHQSADLLEQTISDIRRRQAVQPEELKELLGHLMAMTEAVYAITDLRRELAERASSDQGFVTNYRLQWIRSLMRRFSEAFRNPRLNFRDLERILRELDKALSSFDTTSLFEYLQSYDNLIQNLSSQLKKRVQRIAYSGIDVQFKRPVIQKLNDVILHCLRNAVDHGIESPALRHERGKRPEGLITIDCSLSNGIATVTISDDGKGLSREEIAFQAVRMELITAEQSASMSDVEIFKLIFRPGFSTKSEQSDISGRGVGMDVVHSVIASLQGTIEISSKLGSGTTFILSFREDQCSYQPSFKMLDMQRILQETYLRVENSLASRNLKLNWPVVDRMYFVFAEQHALEALVNNFLIHLFSIVEKGAVIHVSIYSHQGKRRMDSHEFYRLVFDIKRFDGQKILVNTEAFDSLKEYCQPLDAVIRMNQELVEFNIPSNLPPRYHDIKLRFAISQQYFHECQLQIESYMKQYLQGFSYEISDLNVELASPEDINLLILSRKELATFLSSRTEMHVSEHEDFLIVMSQGEGPLRHEMAEKWGEKLLYLQENFTPEQFMQSIEAIVSRQLASRMMQAEPSKQEVKRSA